MMELRFNVKGEQRKALVQAVSQLVGWEPVYKGAPSFAYAVSDYLIERDGTLQVGVNTDETELRKLLAGLKERGFIAEGDDVLLVAEEAVEAEGGDGIVEPASENSVIEFPKEKFSPTALANLRKIVDSKAELIKMSLGLDDLPIIETKETVRFPWVLLEASPEQFKAVSQFVCALCHMANSLKWVTANPKEVVNGKYEFRCFLLRLGMIGDEYKATRKALMARMKGNGAFKVPKQIA